MPRGRKPKQIVEEEQEIYADTSMYNTACMHVKESPGPNCITCKVMYGKKTTGLR